MKHLLFFAIITATICSCGQKTEELNQRIDSLQTVLKNTTDELNQNRRDPKKLLAKARIKYEAKKYSEIQAIYDTLAKYHAESSECAAANKILIQAAKDREEARKAEAIRKAQAERERIIREEREGKPGYCENCGRYSKIKLFVNDARERYWLCDACLRQVTMVANSMRSMYNIIQRYQ